MIENLRMLTTIFCSYYIRVFMNINLKNILHLNICFKLYSSSSGLKSDKKYKVLV